MHTFAPFLAALAALAGCIACTAAHAQSCGAALTSSITLAADMDCRGEPFALKIAADDVTVHLNGRRILGNGGTGIVVSGRHRLTVRGPGRIEQFGVGIDAESSDRLTVTGVELVNAGDAGIALTRSRDAVVQFNRFRGFAELAAIDIRQPAGASERSAGGHQIMDNAFDDVFVGIGICGADAGGNRITRNAFARIIEHALLVRDEATYNTIDGNKFRGHRAVVTVISAQRNMIYANAWEGGDAAIHMFEAPAAGCLTRDDMVARASRNTITYNRFYGTTQPIAIDAGSVNRIHGNTTQDAAVGLAFGKAARSNDASGNVYVRTATPVVDHGVGNTWP